MALQAVSQSGRYQINQDDSGNGSAPGSKPHVLVVDDENGPRQALRMLLKEEFEVHLCSDAFRAIQVLQEEPIELVITDVRMPKRSGVDLLRESKDLRPDVQVIIFTGYGQLETAMKAVEYGAFAYIEKPFDNQVMLNTVRSAQGKYREERERRALENLAMEASRFETLGRLVSGLMHDLGSPLTVINSHIELLMMKPDREDLLDRLQTIQKQVQYCGDMARHTMNYLRQDKGQADQTPFHDVLQTCLEVAKPLFRERKVVLKTNIPEDLPSVNGDLVMIRQAVMNIITNAMQAMQDQDSERNLWIEAEANADQIRLRIEDSGPGIPPEHRESVFDTFFSTKGTSGTGLGLGVVRNVMRRCGGSVEIVDGRGSGACFMLQIPIGK